LLSGRKLRLKVIGNPTTNFYPRGRTLERHNTNESVVSLPSEVRR
jgi:hypothetical protein